MMDDVRGPEQSAFVADAMEPVVGKILSKKQNSPGPPLVSNLENGKAVDRGICAEHQRLAYDTDQHVAGAHTEAGRGVLEPIEIAAHHGVKHDLQQKKGDEAGDRQINEIRNLRHV